ncbi:hypothetical protein JOF41_000003 [Saccharothrix coeruleofusca]|uniref:DUF2975 domain-containing protein n=1 Tax=Saccharothrix coeruleofusca TaxID=33919 RepID=UPI001AE99435|nr:DUF2975 domain-containing protein [Saccharothrix coeruleofusca]MBP2333825.1 hypothetical protein [Saccharothrix coeruleofusca]
MTTKSERDPLQPLFGTLSLLFPLAALVLVAGAALGVFRSLRGSVCFPAPGWTIPSEVEPASPLRQGARVSRLDFGVCLDQPTLWERVLGCLVAAPVLLCTAGALYLLLALLRRAAADGVHTVGTAARVRRFGLYLLVAPPVASLVEAAALRSLPQHAVTRDLGGPDLFAVWDFPWWAPLVGLGMMSLARIMSASAEMREDLEGTV